jgi:hypothetical protein
MGNVNMVAIERSLAKNERLADERARAEQDRRTDGDEGANRAKANDLVKRANQIHGEPEGEVSTAPKHAMQTATSRPLRKTRDAWFLLKGTSVGYVIAKAALLLLVCWIVGAARYIPPFVEVFGFSLLPF